jgi:hypothetical protein
MIIWIISPNYNLDKPHWNDENWIRAIILKWPYDLNCFQLVEFL